MLRFAKSTRQKKQLIHGLKLKKHMVKSHYQVKADSNIP